MVVILPNALLTTVAFGKPKFTLLKTLKNSERNWSSLVSKKPENLEHPDIHIPKARSAQCVDTRISERTQRIHSIRFRIKPLPHLVATAARSQ